MGEDGQPREIVGAWAIEKHDRIRKYIDISRHARHKFLSGRSGSAGYIDLFCGTGQARVRDSRKIIDGSALVAFKSARDGGNGFTEVHVGDLMAEAANATRARLAAIGAIVSAHVGSADQTVQNVVKAINPYGLHFAVLDPYKLESLTFELIRTLSRLKHIDILMHVSAMDLQRNLGAYSEADQNQLDKFAPGWRSAVDIQRPQAAIRAGVLTHWSKLVQGLGFSPPRYDLVRGSGKQKLYWLAFISRHEIANDFWDKIRYIHGQNDLFG